MVHNMEAMTLLLGISAVAWPFPLEGDLCNGLNNGTPVDV
jgi:hypothetical protein